MAKLSIDELITVFGWDAEKAAKIHEYLHGPEPELTGATKELFGREFEPYVPPRDEE